MRRQRCREMRREAVGEGRGRGEREKKREVGKEGTVEGSE